MRTSLKKMVLSFAGPWWTLVGRLVPKDPRFVAVNAFPDFDDTTRALAMALRGTGRRLVILTTARHVQPPEWLRDCDVTIAYRYSARGVWLYHRAKFVLFTHGCFSAWKPVPSQVVVNVWHGMPMKNIGLLDGKSPGDLPQFHYTIASDAVFQRIIAAAFGVSTERVLIADHPRVDVLRRGSVRMRADLPEHRKLVMWLPTYRASVKGDVRVDGDEHATIFAGGVDLTRVDALLSERACLCLVKPHPMAKVDPKAFDAFRSLRLVDEAWLQERGSSLYELLGESDLLITDVSSVYFDYRELGRPVVLFCPDLRRYAGTRGFVAPLDQLVRHEILETEEAFVAKLDALLGDERKVAAEPVADPAASRSLLERVGAL